MDTIALPSASASSQAPPSFSMLLLRAEKRALKRSGSLGTRLLWTHSTDQVADHKKPSDTMVSNDESLAHMTSSWPWYMGVYVAFCLVYIFVGMKIQFKLIRGLLKCAPIILLIYTCVSILQRFGRGPVGHVELTRHFERLLFGLIFSCIGDFYLVFEGFFIHGIASFAIAQLIYVSLFHGHKLILLSPSYNELLVGIAVAVVSLSVYSYLLPKLNRILAISLGGYCILISLMLWSSLVQILHSHDGGTFMGVIGAAMFYTSDLLLGVNRWRIKILFGSELVIVTYYVAQLLIFWSQIVLFE